MEEMEETEGNRQTSYLVYVFLIAECQQIDKQTDRETDRLTERLTERKANVLFGLRLSHCRVPGAHR